MNESFHFEMNFPFIKAHLKRIATLNSENAMSKKEIKYR